MEVYYLEIHGLRNAFNKAIVKYEIEVVPEEISSLSKLANYKEHTYWCTRCEGIEAYSKFKSIKRYLTGSKLYTSIKLYKLNINADISPITLFTTSNFELSNDIVIQNKLLVRSWVTNTKLSKRHNRLVRVNELLRCIGSCGRKFFYYEKTGKFSVFTIDGRGRLWFVTPYRKDYTEKVYLHYKQWYIQQGGTLQSLVKSLKDYIMKDKPLTHSHFGPWPEWLNRNDLWGYGDDMSIIRDTALQLGIIEQ